jgi:hypothetical protein
MQKKRRPYSALEAGAILMAARRKEFLHGQLLEFPCSLLFRAAQLYPRSFLPLLAARPFPPRPRPIRHINTKRSWNLYKVTSLSLSSGGREKISRSKLLQYLGGDWKFSISQSLPVCSGRARHLGRIARET